MSVSELLKVWCCVMSVLPQSVSSGAKHQLRCWVWLFLTPLLQTLLPQGLCSSLFFLILSSAHSCEMLKLHIYHSALRHFSCWVCHWFLLRDDTSDIILSAGLFSLFSSEVVTVGVGGAGAH